MREILAFIRDELLWRPLLLLVICLAYLTWSCI